MVTWLTLPFAQLNTTQLYKLLRLRVNVFVVEQNCPYEELDNLDEIEGVQHVLGYQDGQLIAYARLMPVGVSYDHVSLGRIAIMPEARGQGIGHKLMDHLLEQCHHFWPEEQILELNAQAYLQGYYEQHGFKPTSEIYLLDNIPHIHMRRDSNHESQSRQIES